MNLQHVTRMFVFHCPSTAMGTQLKALQTLTSTGHCSSQQLSKPTAFLGNQGTRTSSSCSCSSLNQKSRLAVGKQSRMDVTKDQFQNTLFMLLLCCNHKRNNFSNRNTQSSSLTKNGDTFFPPTISLAVFPSDFSFEMYLKT